MAEAFFAGLVGFLIGRGISLEDAKAIVEALRAYLGFEPPLGLTGYALEDMVKGEKHNATVVVRGKTYDAIPLQDIERHSEVSVLGKNGAYLEVAPAIQTIKTVTEPVIIIPQPEGLKAAGFYTAINASLKPAYTLTTDYIKGACIVPPYATVASPTGMMNSYEGGFICRALIYKAGTGEVALAKSCLDEWVKLQKSDGSWSQQYYPYLNASALHDEYEDLQVDSGTALLVWAMAEYDKAIGVGSIVYKSAVQLAYNFLREAQLALYQKVGSALLCNQRKAGYWNYTALAADCGEVLLATIVALDQYGDTLTSQNGYSVKTFGNDLYESIALYLWTGDATRYYRTEYPSGATVWGLATVKQQISFTQALCAWAVKLWAGKAYNTKPDYSTQAEKAIDKNTSLCMGKWGGYFYSPYYGKADETRNEYPNHAALMAQAMNTVNATKYGSYITRIKRFIQLAALDKGEVHDYIRPNGMMDVGTNAYYGFLALTAAQGLLAGA